MRTTSLYAIAAMALAACTFEPGGPEDPGPGEGPGPVGPPTADDVDAAAPTTDPTTPEPLYDVECHVTGDRVGQDGLRVKVGSQVVVFDHWTPRTNHPGEYTGFTLSSNASGLRYGVTTTNWIYYAIGLIWSLPQGQTAIARVDFCYG